MHRLTSSCLTYALSQALDKKGATFTWQLTCSQSKLMFARESGRVISASYQTHERVGVLQAFKCSAFARPVSTQINTTTWHALAWSCTGDCSTRLMLITYV